MSGSSPSTNPPQGDAAGNASAIAKQRFDVAFASELLESGTVNDHQLASVIRNWSIHGSTPLAEHLVGAEKLSSERAEDIKRRAAKRISDSDTARAATNTKLSAGSSLIEALEQYDKGGRVARLLRVGVGVGIGESSVRRAEGRYELLRKLGQGGLGRVWLARDQMLDRVVALKELSDDDCPSPELVDRFRREAEITGRLEHPGIVPIHQMGSDKETGAAFYTMRFLGKKTLQDEILEHHHRREEGVESPLRLRHLLRDLISICNAVGHAHAHKVVHRDLKPDNVVIDSFDQVIVIDWGLAKVLDDLAPERVSDSGGAYGLGLQTREGQLLGTLLYMSPEQAAGRIDDIDERTDIYGLGGILFSILTGCSPHELLHAEMLDSGRGERDIVTKIAAGPSPTVEAFTPDVDKALAAICAKAMAWRPHTRYESATALAEDLQLWLSGEPVSAYTEPPRAQLRRWFGRRPYLSRLLTAAAAVLFAAAMSSAFVMRQAQSADRQRVFDRMRGDAHEIELKLHAETTDLGKNTRFIASLPPIQGLIKAQANPAKDNPVVWRERLETIYSGMLRANPDYLSVAYYASQPVEGGEARLPAVRFRELARVERSVNDRSLIVVAPAISLDVVNSPFLMHAAQLAPGEVASIVRQTAADARYRQWRLESGLMVYDEATGAPFGVVTVAADISGQLREILAGLRSVVGEVYVGTGDGDIWLMADSERGPGVWREGESLVDIESRAQQALESELLPAEATDGETFFVRKFKIGINDLKASVLVRLTP
ncbi:Serine/threonine-protein kinase PrkC [Pseudobythopirellula maris]|uniref:Serine/threonine-protein kinase PrkC n=1 Tax=Pseudobythopirellula maris TaxID=2527991 RepID=A0A5C5ZLP1_9BACT|nr:serine/threonine-protein kinase [Pseudobythopirellula maris]TWT88319.1 Serine/threonine-protein kinase PrkC [Pseudobythopirellula maris]